MKNKKLNSARLLFTASCCFCGWRDNQRALSAFYFTVILLHVSNPTPAFGFFTCRWDATGTLTSDLWPQTKQAYKSQHDQKWPRHKTARQRGTRNRNDKVKIHTELTNTKTQKDSRTLKEPDKQQDLLGKTKYQISGSKQPRPPALHQTA